MFRFKFNRHVLRVHTTVCGVGGKLTCAATWTWVGKSCVLQLWPFADWWCAVLTGDTDTEIIR